MINKYDNYIETDCKWVDKTPKHWSVYRAGALLSERRVKVDDINYPALSVTMSGVVEQLSNIAKTSDGDNRKLVKKNDFVINSRSDRKGSSGIAPRDGSVSVINIVLQIKEADRGFIQYLLKSYYFVEELFRNGQGIHGDLWTTKWEQFKCIKIPTPPIKEQQLITKYLDKETQRINNLINKAHKKIALLKEYKTAIINRYVTKGLDSKVKMKDSGIELLGKIPKHWRVMRLANIGKFWKCKNITNGDLVDKGDPVILYSHIYTSYNRVATDPVFYITKKLSQQVASISKGDFLFTSSGESIDEIGKCVLYDGDKNVSVGGDVTILSPLNDKDFNNNFLSFVLNSSYANNYKSSQSRGDIIVHIYSKQLKNLYIAVPPQEEQKKIAKQLIQMETNTDGLVDKYNRKIKLLKEYKDSLISSVVTGKVRVTEEML